MSRRYIDADALIRDIENCSYETWSKGVNPTWWAQAVKVKDNIKQCIERQPTADVEEIVRCKDCIHAREVKHRGEVIEGIYRCSYIKMSTNLFDIDYCRYGKRKEENEG